MTGDLAILNVGDGDTKLSFDKANPVERARAARIVMDMLHRGYALMIAAGQIDGDTVYRRATGFDPETCEYLIVGDPPEEAVQPDRAQVSARAIGSAGGKARAKALPPRRRSEIARGAAKKRWGEGDTGETPAPPAPDEPGGETGEHAVEDAGEPAPASDTESQATAPRRGRGGARRIPADKTSAVAIGRSSGG